MADIGIYRVSDSSLSAMLQSIPAHISIIDPDLNVVWANDIAENKFGNDLTGRKCYEAYHGVCSSHPGQWPALVDIHATRKNDPNG